MEDSSESYKNIVTGDMGGTTFDVGVVYRGAPLNRSTSWHDQYEYFVPTLDVRSVGSGGGSIVHFDKTSESLRIGPRSAGALPGPVCYSRGGREATVTDADLVAGYLNPEYFLRGRIRLDRDAAARVLSELGRSLGFSAEETAAAAIRIVDNQMADAIRLISVNQGLDPREFILYTFGGAGPIHAAAIAMELGMSTVIVPLSDLASGWSAFGIAGSQPLVVQEVAHPMREPFDPKMFDTLFANLEREATGRLARQGVARADMVLTRHADVRYSLQINEVEVDAPAGSYDKSAIEELIGTFEDEYARMYGEGSGYPEAGFAITGLRVRGRGRIEDLTLPPANEAATSKSPNGLRDVLFPGYEPIQVPIYDLNILRRGADLAGPAIVELPDTSIVVPPNARLRVDGNGSAVVSILKSSIGMQRNGEIANRHAEGVI